VLTGIIGAPYDVDFRRKHQTYLSVLKKLGFGHRVMERKIHEEVAEFIEQARHTKGQTFCPNNLVHRCIVNVLVGIMFGRRYPFDHPNLVSLQELMHVLFNSIIQELEFLDFLRFVPPFRARLRKWLDLLWELMKKIHDEVSWMHTAMLK
jgi:Cytochrome P450